MSDRAYAHTGLYILPALDGHTHAITDPGHNHEKDDRCHVTIEPSRENGHTHRVLDPGHLHDPGDVRAKTEITLEETDGHTHRVVEYGHRHFPAKASLR
jgi:hypothetical protein